MKLPNPEVNYENYARALVRSRVSKLTGQLHIQRCDLEDLEQEVLAFLYQRLPQFDSDRGSIEAFTNQVVTSKIRNIISHHVTKTQDFTITEYSLDETVQISENVFAARYELVDAQLAVQSREFIECYTHDQLDLKADIDRIIDLLPTGYSELCDALKTSNITDAAREMGISRREAARRVRTIRSILNQYWTEPDPKKFARFLNFVCK